MAMVTAPVRASVIGDRRARDITITYTGATSYATGGIAIAASDFGLVQLDGVDILGSSGGSAVYDQVAGKMRLYVPTTGAEIAAAGDPTGVTIRARGIGY